MTPLLLGALGLVLAHPAPALLARMRWPYRVPRAAIVLWQAMALAAVLAVLGAGLSTSWWLIVDAQHPSWWRIAAHIGVLALTSLVVIRLVWAAWIVVHRNRVRRRRHRTLVDLLADTTGSAPGVRVVADRAPVAYCVPALRKPRVVVSSGALSELDESELFAVLAHERAHVRYRHDLVTEAFTVLRRAFPRGARGDAALRQSQVMVELLADDHARRECGTRPLARALVKLADHPPPAGAMGAAPGSAAQLRMQRLANHPGRYRAEAAGAYALAATLLVVPTVSLAVPWIADAWQSLM